MRFKPDTLGTLVRPRILTAASIIKSGPPGGDFTFSWNKPRKSTRFDHFSIFDKKPQDLFSDLQLGDTTEDLSTCYVGEVTHYIVKVGGQMTMVDKGNVQETLRRVRKLLGVRTNLKVVSVGLQFYKGMERAEDGSLKPISPWKPKTSDGSTGIIWFFNPWELVSMEQIMRYETVGKGDLVLFQKTKGLVVKKKNLNKPKFYNTSSWSCYTITLLNHLGDGFTRFLPDREFTVRRSSDPEPETDEDQR